MISRLKRGGSLAIATHNQGKLREFRELLTPFGIEVLSSGELGVPEPAETGDTFEENAQLKAVITAFAAGKPALADDSGLAVEALGGAPGVHSARWAGEPRDFYRAMARVEEELQAKGAASPDLRRAKFVCMLCLANPSGPVQFFEGTVEGHLVWPPRGTQGFGYDPIFVPDGYGQTFGEMDPAQKHAISHRAAAFAKFRAAILDEN
ncbi:MAG: RdgB/HAM1 family non-canonical purine NTP pyrophosphatase [Rhodomicrobium sp.]